MGLKHSATRTSYKKPQLIIVRMKTPKLGLALLRPNEPLDALASARYPDGSGRIASEKGITILEAQAPCSIGASRPDATPASPSSLPNK